MEGKKETLPAPVELALSSLLVYLSEASVNSQHFFGADLLTRFDDILRTYDPQVLLKLCPAAPY